MKEDELLIHRLTEYSASEAIPFHMPGHKRQAGMELLKDFPSPFTIDITEIDGFDNLHHPQECLKKSMEWAAAVYGSDKTYYLVNGSSGGILSAISAAVGTRTAGAEVGETRVRTAGADSRKARSGEVLVMSRNCHKSAYHGVILNHMHPGYIYPQIIEEMGIQGGILAEDVENQLKRYPEAAAVLIVSPTYDGIVSDIGAIAEVVHRYGLPLLVDEAHGAHFSFGNGRFPVSALECGADLVIQSLHKTLPSLTQTAVLHVKGKRIDIEKLEWYLQIFQSSSPSYVFMASMEQCIFEMEQNGAAYMEAFAKRLGEVRKRLEKLEHLRLLGKEVVGRYGVYDLDCSKLVVSCRDCKLEGEAFTGEAMGRWLRETYKIEMEMCGADYVVAITAYPDPEAHLNRLVEALLELDERLTGGSAECSGAESSGAEGRGAEGRGAEGRGAEGGGAEGSRAEGSEPDICLTPAAALEGEMETQLIEACGGRISGEFVYLYPPGIPILVPGERISEEIIKRIRWYLDVGLPVQGMADQSVRYLKVLKN